MSLRVLTLDSAFDLPTTYLAYWMSRIVEGARLMGHQVLSLRGGEATESNLIGAIESFQPQYLFLGGHGGPDIITTTNLQPLIIACTNDQILSGRQTLFISCFDKETEIFTKSGFKYFRELSSDDLIATLNKEGFLEYHNYLAKQEYPYNGKMIHYKGKTYDLLVTPDHRMYCKYISKKDFSFMSAEELSKRVLKTIEFKKDVKWKGIEQDRFIIQSKGKARGIDVPINTWLNFFGWYLSDGCFKFDKNGQGQIIITQSDKHEKEKALIVKAIKSIGFSPARSRRDFNFHSKLLCNYLSKFGKAHSKFIPQWIKELPPDNLQVLLNSLILGDGSEKYNYYKGKKTENPVFVYYTCSKQLAEDVYEIAFKCGYGVSMGVDNRASSDFGSYVSLRLPLYCVRMFSVSTTPQIYCIPKWVHYEGMVYDVTVPNHTIFVRRNGKSVWSGNCLTGQVLVPSVVSKKGIAAAGFTAEYVWAVSPPYLPAQDVYARSFERMIVEPALEVLRTGSWGSWYSKLQSVAREEEAAWLGSEDPMASQVVLFIRQDKGSATFVSLEEDMPGLDLKTLVIGGYILKTLLG